MSSEMRTLPSAEPVASTRRAMRSIARDARGRYSARRVAAPARVFMNGTTGLSSLPKPPGAMSASPATRVGK